MNLHILHPTRNRTTTAPNFLNQLEHAGHDPAFELKSLGRTKLRPICPEDEPLMIEFHRGLSDESVHLRYFEQISLDSRTVHERLAKVCTNTMDSFAIVAEGRAHGEHSTQILGVGRLTTTDVPTVAEFALLMEDKVLNTELPDHLLKRLIGIARASGFKTLMGELLVADYNTLHLCRKLGFTEFTVPEDGMVKVSYPL